MLIQFIPTFKEKIELIEQRFPIVFTAETKNYSNIIKDNENLVPIIKKVSNLNQKDLSLMYIDSSDEEGTMNFYRLRYSLLPAHMIKYDYYGYLPFDEDLYVRLIKEHKINYLIVHKDNGILEKLGYKKNTNRDVFLKVENYSGNNLETLIE